MIRRTQFAKYPDPISLQDVKIQGKNKISDDNSWFRGILMKIVEVCKIVEVEKLLIVCIREDRRSIDFFDKWY